MFRPMRGKDTQQSAMFSYVSPERRVPADHPLRPIRAMVDVALRGLSRSFGRMYPDWGRPSIAPEKLLRALLLQLLYSIRSERLLMEQLEYNLLFRWFVGLNVDEPVWVPTVFSKNRDRLLEGEIAAKFFAQVLDQARAHDLLSDEHFSVDGTLIEAWASQKSFQRKDDDEARPPDDPGNPTVNFHGEKRSNDTHQSTTDPEARLARKGSGHESKLAYCGNVLIENRKGLVVDTVLKMASGTAERDAAVEMAERIEGEKRVTVGADKGYDTRGFVREMRERNVTPRVGEHQSIWRQRHRRPHDAACRIPGEPAQTETDRRSVRVVKDSGHVAQDPAPRNLQSGMGLHLRGGGLQSSADEEPSGGSLRIIPGRSVRERQ